MEQNTEKPRKKTCCPLQESWNCDGSSPFSMTTRITTETTLVWLRNKNINVLEWPSQIPDLNPIENLWHDLKIAVHQRSPLTLIELEQFCAEELANIAQSSNAKFLETYPNTHSCNCCQRCFHQVLTQWVGWILVKPRYSSFLFSINFLKFVEFVFHLEVVDYDV